MRFNVFTRNIFDGTEKSIQISITITTTTVTNRMFLCKSGFYYDLMGWEKMFSRDEEDCHDDKECLRSRTSKMFWAVMILLFVYSVYCTLTPLFNHMQWMRCVFCASLWSWASEGAMIHHENELINLKFAGNKCPHPIVRNSKNTENRRKTTCWLVKWQPLIVRPTIRGSAPQKNRWF